MRPLLSLTSRPRVVLVLAAVCAAGSVRAEPVPQTMNGLPLLPIPTVEEVGLPPFTMPAGVTALGGSPEPGSSTSAGGEASTGNGALGDGADSRSVASMMSRAWGGVASQYAETVGITPVALAATCQIEASGCQTNPASSSATITGTFQMMDATYTAMMKSALARNQTLAANAVPGLAGKLDPATQSIAAAEYLRQGAVSLQGNGLANPSVLDVRGYYNFGPGNAVAIARANDSDLMSSQISGLTVAQLRSNGIEATTTTVGQWRAGVTAKIGASAASAPVLLAKS